MSESQRTTFKRPRTEQYVEASTLTSMTGQGKDKFADVIVKELMDNALDASESSGVAPEVTLEVVSRVVGDGVTITVGDNAGGIPYETVHDALNFDVLVSDKAAYRSPTRGMQGNALKTVFGIPFALGSTEPIVIEAKKNRHEVSVWKDETDSLLTHCVDTDLDELRAGTVVTAHVPRAGTGDGYINRRDFDPGFWAQAFALFNPHASVRIQHFEEGIYLESKGARFRRFLPSDP
jgi:DNA topoisomerase VI subunit B